MKTFYQLNTIFLSMIMEAIPFVLVGVLISGMIQSFISERWIARIMPKNRVLSALLGASIGVFFPSCECGIVPITKRLLNKGVPLQAGIGFMLTGPIINPIVLFATYIAFGNNWKMVLIRCGMAFAVAVLVSLALSLLFPAMPLKEYTFAGIPSFAAETAASAEENPTCAETDASGKAGAVCAAGSSIRKEPLSPPPAFGAQIRRLGSRFYEVCLHGIDEFFSVGKYLVIGAFIAASMQTFIPTSYLMKLGNTPIMASLVMITLAFIMSLCSEADAFIASSFRSTFSVGPLSAFLVFGPMIDIKNTLMLLGTFRKRFVFSLIGLVTLFTLIGSLLVGRWFG
ncbi:permease [Gorillibacterium sp. sgz500922]|uniref:permease n=1 Tax=Gorillibacterium sp. sgz500922 TaxID=3446694 RepID=UPI003F663EED